MSISQVGNPFHEFEEELSRSYLIWTMNLLKPNLEGFFLICQHTESRLLSLYSAVGFVYLG